MDATTGIFLSPLEVWITVARKTGRATDNYRRTFWNAMRRKNFFDVENALQVGTDSEGGYLVPDEFEHTLVEALEEENCFRGLSMAACRSRRSISFPRSTTSFSIFS